MPNATLIENVDMVGWPRKTYLVLLDEPLNRFDPETGIAEPFSYIALNIGEDGNGTLAEKAYIFPSNEKGEFVDTSMVPMRKLPNSSFPHTILGALGYTVA